MYRLSSQTSNKVCNLNFEDVLEEEILFCLHMLREVESQDYNWLYTDSFPRIIQPMFLNLNIVSYCVGPEERVERQGAHVARRVAVLAGTVLICGRSCQTYGQEESPR